MCASESTLQISSINHGPESNVTNILQLEETRWSWGPSISLTPHDHRFIRAEEREGGKAIAHPPCIKLTLTTHTHTHTHTHTYVDTHADVNTPTYIGTDAQNRRMHRNEGTSCYTSFCLYMFCLKLGLLLTFKKFF